jgi:AraC-like DNA-binding protein
VTGQAPSPFGRKTFYPNGRERVLRPGRVRQRRAGWRSWPQRGPGYLLRPFNAVTGLPPMAYLGQLHTDYAAVLLMHADEPLTSIGRATGWPDQSMFTRRFKVRYGLSATTYRKCFASGAAHLQRPAAAASSAHFREHTATASS